MKFHIKTLGCKMNQADSERIAGQMERSGHWTNSAQDEADLVLVNSCAVTAEASRKSRQAANAAFARGQRVKALGCSVRVEPELWRDKSPRVETVPSTPRLFQSLKIEPGDSGVIAARRTRMPIVIQNGCDDVCSFCITRVARGRHQNVANREIILQINKALELGVREVILTGINLAAWGTDHTRKRPAGARLHQLLADILDRTGIPRIRLSSLGPQYLGDGWFDVFTSSRICDHLHLSVQSGSDSVLRRMLRNHGTREVLEVCARARAVRPDVALHADLIVGFPGESDAEFQETMDFVRQAGLSGLHVFPFSARPGTAAAAMAEQVEGPTKKNRARLLRNLGNELRQEFLRAQLGKTRDVLVEARGQGLTTNYIKVRVEKGRAGGIQPVTLCRENLPEIATN